ncbi:MAG: CPBP family intramembrane metalloprotease [Chloroflexi bacterium]|nr:CPBP family intramembrane metalloprotease [Chloroflexota bacterium]
MKRPLWLDIALMILIPIMGMALGVAVTVLLNFDQENYNSNLVINLFFLTACIGLLCVFKFSRGELGLKIVKEKIRWHVIASLAVFSLYMLFYVFVIRISSLKPISANTVWGLLTYLVVVIAEELYFRGMVYGFFKKRFSGKTALIVSSLLFGIFHASQGLEGILSRTITGWLWGSVRYSSKMIFLLIFPIHFAYNVIWLLFEGNWSDPPVWVIYGLPAIEFLLGLAIVILHDHRSAGKPQS